MSLLKTSIIYKHRKILSIAFDSVTVQQANTTVKTMGFSYKSGISVPDGPQTHFLEALYTFCQFLSLKFGAKAQGWFPVEGAASVPKKSDKTHASQSIFSPAMRNKPKLEQALWCLLQHSCLQHLQKVCSLTLRHPTNPILTQATVQNLDFIQMNRSLIIFLLHTHCIISH